ncbi:MAG TPA: RHS repeat domain-containing protein, partial [Pyrinomonadaceae bacterium]|nr:RHS repeat domain-containing protein [Pyrinomonadaceae bacterium]
MKTSTFKRALAALAAAALAMCFAATTSARQGGTTRYVYDENGRLQAVIAPSGEAVVYEYDAAGNIKAVRRVSADSLAVFAFTPREGIYGDLVSLVGVGFGGGVGEVSFNGSAGRIVEVTPTSIVVEVPQGATTGPITVTTPRGSVTTATPFTVRGVRVEPDSARVLFGEVVLFEAVTSSSDDAVVWSVNGVTGGNSAVGTITPAGLYTAPTQTGTVVVRATLAANPELFGEAVVTVRDPNDVAELRAPGVSVRRGLDNGTALVSSSVAIQFGFPQGTRAGTAAAVSVQHGNADGINAARSPAVSVQRGSEFPAAPISRPVSVAYGSSDAQNSAASSVSATTGPYVAAVAPAAAARSSTVTLTITGANLSGASALQFINSSTGALATGLTVTGISVSPDGTTLTATLAVASNASTGQFVVVVATPSGDSL